MRRKMLCGALFTETLNAAYALDLERLYGLFAVGHVEAHDAPKFDSGQFAGLCEIANIAYGAATMGSNPVFIFP